MTNPLYDLPRISKVGEFIVKAGCTLGNRKLTEYELVYFPGRSQTKYQESERVYVLSEPCFILTKPSIEHKYIFDPIQPIRHLFIHFRIDIEVSDSSFSNFILNGPSFIAASENSIVPKMLHHILSLANKKTLHWNERCNHLLLAVLMELYGTFNSIPEDSMHKNIPYQLVRALNFIDSHLKDSLTISEIAGSVGWTHEHFSRVFTQHIGHPPQKAIMIRRIQRACQLLLKEQWSVKQIAFAVGFKDEHYFSRSFMKVNGMTASAYREKYADPRQSHLAPVDEHASSYPLNKYLLFENLNNIK